MEVQWLSLHWLLYVISLRLHHEKVVVLFQTSKALEMPQE